MRRLCPTLKRNSTAVFLRHFLGCGGTGFSTWFLLLFLLFRSAFGLAQDRSNQAPIYNHLFHQDLPTVTANFSTFSVNSEDLTIAIATDPEGNVYTLSFGKGVDKRDEDGNLIDDNFINGLNSPMDIAIDDEGYIFIADFEASGNTYEDNGQIKIYDPQGNYVRSILTSYFRPLGVDVDEEFVYIAEYNDGEQGPESTPSSRVRKVSKITGTPVAVNENISVPFRIAINSQGQVYVSKAGNGSAVLTLSQDLNVLGQLSNVQSPGSIEIDAFDYVHVLEYSGRIDFSEFINFANMSFNEIRNIAEDIDRGIDAEAFGIKIFDPSHTLKSFVKQAVDFPVDLAFNSCDRMYLNNGDMFGGNVPFLGYIPQKLEFDLEVYQRTPSADITPPVASCVSSFTIDLVTGGSRTITGEDLNDGSLDICGDVNFNLSKSTFTEADEGPNYITLTVIDEQGITSTCEALVQVNVEDNPDTTKPTFTYCENQSFSASAGQCGAVVNYQEPTATDDSGTANVEWVSGPKPGDFVDVGNPVTVVYRATDEAGNYDDCTFTITVTDDQDPEIASCPGNISETVAFGETGKHVDFNLPTFTDNCPGATIAQTAGLPSGSEFPVGETITNTFVVTDAVGKTATCSFTVTISENEDTEDPVFENCPAAVQHVEAEAGECGAVVEYELPTATDNSGYVQVTKINGPDSDTFFEVGQHIIHFIAEDEAGNTAECFSTIEVHDTQPPVANCVSPFTLRLENGTASLNEDDIDAGSSDNCSGISRSISRYSFTSADIGVVPVTLTVTDEAGLTDECTVNITIEDPTGPEPPEAVCNDLTIPLDENGLANITADQVYGGGDNSLDLTIDISSFDCSDIGGKSVLLTVTDPATGLSDTCNASITVVDPLKPDVFCVAPGKTFTLSNGSVTVDVHDILGGLDDNCGVKDFWLSQETFTTAGTKNISIFAEDTSGNIDECTTTIEIVEGSSTPGSCKPAIIYLDDLGFATLEPEEVFDGNPNDPTITGMSVDKENFSCEDLDDAVRVVLTVDYADGSQTSCTATVTVKDDIDPVVSCVPEFTLNLNEEGYGILSADILDRGSSDNCGISRMSLSKTRFETSDVGEQPVILTVTDTSGNSATCETTVTVVAHENSAGVSCPQDITISLRDDGQFELVLSYSGNEENIEIEVSKSHFTCEDIGTQVVTATYYGEHTGSCDINVTVVDDMAPVAECVQEIDLSLNASGTASLTAEDLDLNSTDNCGIPQLSLSKYNFTKADVGLQEVIFTATDDFGNESTCNVTVNVISNEEVNRIECVDRLLIEIGENGRAILNPRDLFTGGSGTAQYTVSKDNFSCTDLGENTVTLNYSTPNEEGSCEVTVIVEDPENRCEVQTEPAGEYIILYPNPSGGLIRFQTSPGLIIQHIEVFDMRGRFLFERSYEPEFGFQDRVDLREYQSGVYSILITTNGKQFLKRAIIRNE